MHVRERELDEEPEGPFTMDRAWQAVRRRARLVALVSGSIILLGTLIVSTLPTRYEATATVQIDPRKSNLSSIGNNDMPLAPGANADSEIEIVASRNTILRVIDELDLRNDPEFTEGGPFKKLIRMVLGRPNPVPAGAEGGRQPNADPIGRIISGELPATSTSTPDEVALSVSERLSVVRVRMTPLFEIRFNSTDPQKSARIANAIARSYLAGQVEEKKQSASVVSGLMEQQLNDLKQRVSDAERKVEEFKTANNIHNAGSGEDLTAKQVTSQMERQINARNATAEAKASYEQIRRIKLNGGNVGDLGDILSSLNVTQLKDGYARAARHKAELETKYGPRHPELQKAQADHDEALSLLNRELKRYEAKFKNDYEIAMDRERQLAESMATFKNQQSSVNHASVKLKELEREAQTAKQIFEALLGRFKQVSETQSLQLPDSRIVEMAEVPLYPSAPKRFRLMIIVLLAGLGAGVGLALAFEFLNNGISRPEDVEQSLDLNHLSSLPAIPETGGRDRDLSRPARLVLTDPHSVFAEAIRGIRREIDQRRPDDAPRIILVTSGLPGEGSELIASNLAHHYAMTGHSILLVDGDLRRWNLTRRLMTPQTQGLLDVLSNGLPVDRALLRDTGTGLHFLAATGSMPLDVSSPELLVSQRMTHAIEQLKQRFDTIVIDAPPLLPVVDGRILADYADQIVYVTNWRRTPTQLSKRAIKSLGVNQEKIAGVVVNEVDPAILDDAPGYAPGPRTQRAA